VRSILVRIATTTVAALALITAAASPVQAAGQTNCNDVGATTPCFEKIWSDGAQVKMTFVDLNPAPSGRVATRFTAAESNWAGLTFGPETERDPRKLVVLLVLRLPAEQLALSRFVFRIWSRRPDSNRRPAIYKSGGN
jgi:hypothetical protein